MGCPLYGVSAIERYPLYVMSGLCGVRYMECPL